MWMSSNRTATSLSQVTLFRWSLMYARNSMSNGMKKGVVYEVPYVGYSAINSKETGRNVKERSKVNFYVVKTGSKMNVIASCTLYTQ